MLTQKHLNLRNESKKIIMHESFLRLLGGGWCPFANAAARGAVGSHCHFVKRGWFWQSCGITVKVWVFFNNFAYKSASRPIDTPLYDHSCYRLHVVTGFVWKCFCFSYCVISLQVNGRYILHHALQWWNTHLWTGTFCSGLKKKENILSSKPLHIHKLTNYSHILYNHAWFCNALCTVQAMHYAFNVCNSARSVTGWRTCALYKKPQLLLVLLLLSLKLLLLLLFTHNTVHNDGSCNYVCCLAHTLTCTHCAQLYAQKIFYADVDFQATGPTKWIYFLSTIQLLGRLNSNGCLVCYDGLQHRTP